jgi:alcohol dehydrogenase class IV
MEAFTYISHPARVVFGHGTLDQLGAEMDRLGMRRAFIAGTPSQAAAIDGVAAAMGDRVAHIWPRPAMHAPVEVTAEALKVLEQSGADGLIAIGGGSAIGMTKALALRTGMDQIVVPTTYSGSEMTNVLGQTEEGVKTTSVSPEFLPETVIYDVDLTMELPVGLSGLSGMNAIAHAVESLYAANRNPITCLMGEEAIRAMACALPAVAADPSNREARSDALYGAWACSLVLGMSAMGLHHKLAHVCGGTFNLSHAHTHTILLPHSLAYNAPAVQPAMERMARAIGREDVPQALRDIADSFGAPQGLKDIGMPEEGIDRAVEIFFRNPYDNPRQLAEEPIRNLLRRAWKGDAPITD